MTYKQIETLREVRMWIGQIVVPVIVTGFIVLTNPTVQHKFKEIRNNVKNKCPRIKIIK